MPIAPTGSHGGDPNVLDAYASAYLPAPKFSLRLGGEFWRSARFGLGPDFSLDMEPMWNRQDGSFGTFKLRFQAGLRILLGVGRGHALFARMLVGGESFLPGKVALNPPFGTTTGFAAEPGVGAQFRLSPRLVAGVTLGFPIGVQTIWDFGPARTHAQVDFDTTGFVGLRL